MLIDPEFWSLYKRTGSAIRFPGSVRKVCITRLVPEGLGCRELDAEEGE